MAGKAALLGAITAGLLLSGYTAPAFADKGDGGHGARDNRMIERLDADKDGKVTLAEYKAQIAAAFKAFDLDGNGAITKQEIEKHRAALRDLRKTFRDAKGADKEKAGEALRAAGPAMLPGAGRMFDRVDTDKSGTLSEAEVMVAAEKMFERRDTNKDGVIDGTDARGGKHHGKEHGKHHKGDKANKHHKGDKGDKDRKQHAARMIERADTDRDGKISQAEYLQHATKVFESLDTDKNGEVTKAEFDAKRTAFEDARKAYRDVKAEGGKAKDDARAAMREARMDPMAVRMFKRADADNNGTLTKAEMETAATAMFKRQDRNGDGFITADEIGKRGE